jgi:hypothetical protein
MTERVEVRNGHRKKGSEKLIYKRYNPLLNSEGYFSLVKFNQMLFKYNGKYMGGALSLPPYPGKK